MVWTGSVSSVSLGRGDRESPTSVRTQAVRRHHKLMTGSRTKMMSWGSRRDWGVVTVVVCHREIASKNNVRNNAHGAT